MARKAWLLLLLIPLAFVLMRAETGDSGMVRAPIANVREATRILLRKSSDQGAIHAIKIRCVGRLEGEAKLTLLLAGEEYQVRRLAEDVDVSFGGDWYADQAELRYEPQGVRAGKLEIRYHFSD